jgi:hypothetical protein
VIRPRARRYPVARAEPLSKGGGRSRGQALVEFSLVAPMLFLLILGAIEGGRYIFFNEVLSNSAREGARFAIVHGSGSSCPSGPPAPGTKTCDLTGENIKLHVEDAAMNLVGLGELVPHDPVWTTRASTTPPSPGDASTGTNARGEHVTVFVDFTYRPILGEVFDLSLFPEITIEAESTLVINY